MRGEMRQERACLHARDLGDVPMDFTRTPLRTRQTTQATLLARKTFQWILHVPRLGRARPHKPPNLHARRSNGFYTYPA